MITLWGPSSTGKTALLSFLYLRSQAVKTDWHIFPTESSLGEIIQQSRRILRENEFPLGTKEGVNEREIAYDFQNQQTGAVYRMETKDRAGSRAENMDVDIVDGLKSAEGIVLFLDHGRGHRETEVIDTLTQLYVAGDRKTQKDMRPLAVCLSKADQLVKRPEDFRRLQSAPEQFVRDQLSDELVRWIGQYHGRVKFFPVSSVGLRLSYGSIQKSVFFDEKMVLRVTPRGNPINIVEPFTWIFEELQERP